MTRANGVLVLLLEAVATSFAASEAARRDADALLETMASAIDAAEHFDDAQDGERDARSAINDGLSSFASVLEILERDASADARRSGLRAVAAMIRRGVEGQALSFGPYPASTRAWLEEADAKTAALHEETYRAVLGTVLPSERPELLELAAQIGLLIGRLGQLRDDSIETEAPLLVGDHVFALAWLAELDDAARATLAGEVPREDLERLRTQALASGARAHARVLAERLFGRVNELTIELVGPERSHAVLASLRGSLEPVLLPAWRPH
jgi:geranylgeranyl pyrophosphate synthase